MPNNCFGTLTITANSDLLTKILDTVHGTGYEEDNPLDFDKIIPMPENIYRGSIGPEEKKIYGKNNWYDWSIENWGTKWNSCDTTFDLDTFSFWTAWSPCSPVIKRLAEMFPDACFDYYYDESGAGFCGEERYENGKLVYIMEADLSERWYDDEDDVLPPDFEDGREEEKRIYVEENDQYKIGEFHRFHDEDICRTIVDGMFCEGTDDDLRERLYEKLYGKEPALK